jgi:hypothetical protein
VSTCTNENMRLSCIVVILIISSVYERCGADKELLSNQFSSKLVKLERMRHKQHFTPMEQGSATERNNGQDVKPAEQIALFRASAKQRISDRLTQLFDSSRNTERAREMAKDKINQRLKEMEDAQNQEYGHEEQAQYPVLPRNI